MAMSLTASDVAAQLGSGWKARCPAHDDKHASLVIYDRPNGGINVKCMAQCEQSAVIARLQSMRLWPESGRRTSPSADAAKKDRKRREAIIELVTPVPAELAEPDWDRMFRSPVTDRYAYRDLEGALLGFVVRFDAIGSGKHFLPLSAARQLDGGLTWAIKAPQTYTLYGLEQLRRRPGADDVLVEGEKAANKGRILFPDKNVLSWRGGAGAVEKNDFSPLCGRNVTIIPDADEPGRKAAVLAADAARAAGAATVQIVAVPAHFDKGWDIADPLPSGWTLEALLAESADSEQKSEVDGEKLLAAYVISAADLVKLEIEPREYIVEPFLATQSLNMLYAVRGIGKTWVGFTLAINVARGEDFLGYSVERERNVLYIDGEMPLPDIKERLQGLAHKPPHNLKILPSDVLFREDRPLNIQEPEDRARIERLLADLESDGERPDLLIFDNLSSLSGGIDENDNSALDMFLRWLVGLRHAGYAILMIHHAGKSGTQRGASRREDLLDTSIELKKPAKDKDDEEAPEPHSGAHFVLSFPKTRGRRPEPEELELKLCEYNGELAWTIGEIRTLDRSIKLLRSIWQYRPEKQKDLTQITGLGAPRISQLCTKLRRRKLIEPTPSILLTTAGLEALLNHFPELEKEILKQGKLFERDVL